METIDVLNRLIKLQNIKHACATAICKHVYSCLQNATYLSVYTSTLAGKSQIFKCPNATADLLLVLR